MVHILYLHLVHHALQMTPQVEIKSPPRSARGMETSVATPRDSSDQSHDLETADLSNGKSRYLIPRMEACITLQNDNCKIIYSDKLSSVTCSELRDVLNTH
jgi:hypothetical protein